MSTSFGAQSAWRQLVDLIGRGRAPASDAALARLRTIRDAVALPVRAASARALAFASPPAMLVSLFAEDALTVSAPVLRTAQLEAREWIAILPRLTPAARSILRHRRDLPAAVVRALESFGSVDFVLGAPDAVAAEPLAADTAHDVVSPEQALTSTADPVSDTPDFPQTIAAVSPFVSIATAAAGIPLVAEARRQAERAGTRGEAGAAPSPQGGTFPIAELVARIDAYQRQREEVPSTLPSQLRIDPQFALFAHDPQPAEGFRFETDAGGIVRWIEGAARAPLIGLSLDSKPASVGSQVDGVAAGAFRRRASFADARLVVDGHSDAAGQWRISAIPVFDRANGRFAGYRGTARRPRPDETAAPTRETRNPGVEALRQLVHELRTPTNAIAGFSEMIESQMLGPVPAGYRAQAAAIRSQTSSLLNAIDDLDMAARLETHALDLRAGDVPVAPLFAQILADLAPLATLRGAILDFKTDDEALAILGDDRAVERLVARLLATLVASGSLGERIATSATRSEAAVVIQFDRPRALAAYPEESLLTIDAEAEAEREGAPLLGTGFALRLARNLAAELRGSLVIGDKSLTLRLPAAFPASMGQASSN
ncbi:sensor histidine kinase [Sphingomonas sp. RB3P16]|uniref:sensor histidine kinase n=1 Tax=Parasphingomonas frigoris TaxID=3096163 RepID=UPI003FA7CD69